MTRLIEVVLIEDNPADADLMRESIEAGRLHLQLSIAIDGEAGLKLIRNSRPDLVLLDLNLPGKSGRELLSEMKADPVLRSIPVVVLTSSDAEIDILESYSLGASCFITKPVDLQSFFAIVKSMENFWFTVVKFPSHRGESTSPDK